MSTTVGIVWNPSKVTEQNLRGAVNEAATGADSPIANSTDALWFETTPEDAGQEATGRALDAGCTLVIAAGGDGTVRAVAERLGETGSPAADLGIVPLGTGNLLARNLGIPLGKPARALTRALTGEAAPLDLGRVTFTDADGHEESQGFVVMIGFGIDAQMIVETDDDLKAKAGWLAYIESLGRAAEGTDVVDFEIAVDDAVATQDRAHTMLVGNCGTLQGGFTLLPDAEPDDGELDLLVLSADTAADWLDTLRNFTWNSGLRHVVEGTRDAIKSFAARALPGTTHEDSDTAAGAESSESAAHLRAKRVAVSLAEPLEFEVDGDNVGAVTGFAVEILPSALRVR